MRTSVRTAGCAVAVAAVAIAPLAATAPTVAAPVSSQPAATTDFTAGVRSIDHGLGIVTVTGTAPVGTSVHVAGDVETEEWTEADRTGAWSAAVRVAPGSHVVRVTAAVSGRVVDLPVELLLLTPPGMLATVDGIARSVTLDGTGYPRAHFVIKDGGQTVGETDADADGAWSFTLRDLSFGDHHVEAFQYFDGTQNGGVDDVYAVSGAAVVTAADASRETDRITLVGRAPAGTELTFADAGGPIDAVRVPVGADTNWRVELPIPDDARFHTVTVTTHDGATELGTTDAHVTVPVALTGGVEELPDGSVRLSGTGENGATVDLETEDGTAVTDDHGAPIRTTVGRTWELTVARDELPADVVVARQRIDGVEQGGLRLVLPRLPHRPGPGESGAGGASGPGVSTGVHPDAHRVAAAKLASGPGRLASTGTEATGALGVAAALVLAGSGLSVLRVMRRRRPQDQ
ncbi:hypothetical protein ACO0E1_12270 [Curtobacterium sp. RRHDQ66]|uniref:hypothetical protein n=1 Tax=Curtobacterium guangdongense TaxID=3413380 RepID=UPI003BF1FD2C